jgi:hypothetical protein
LEVSYYSKKTTDEEIAEVLNLVAEDVGDVKRRALGSLYRVLAPLSV